VPALFGKLQVVTPLKQLYLFTRKLDSSAVLLHTRYAFASI